MSQPLVTAIVSTYNAEHFIRGCMDDLVAQTMFHNIEVLVIDSGSLQAESAICAEFAREHPQIRLIRTQREPLYAAWNRAISLARGKYLTNANTDDRHHPQFMELMTSALDRQPEVALVYAEQLVSHTENETFEECQRRDARVRRLPDFTPEDLLMRCITGSQPVWRKSLHDELGVFDTRYQIAADYDMWLRFASQNRFLRVPGPLGVIFDSPNTISGINNWSLANYEILDIHKCYMAESQWRTLPFIKKRLAAQHFSRGYQHITRDHDPLAAEPFFREAIKLDPTNLSFLKTYLIRCIPAKFIPTLHLG